MIHGLHGLEMLMKLFCQAQGERQAHRERLKAGAFSDPLLEDREHVWLRLVVQEAGGVLGRHGGS